MKELDYHKGLYKSVLTKEGEIHLVRLASVPRSELLTTDLLLKDGLWVTTEMEEFGDAVTEKYRKFSFDEEDTELEDDTNDCTRCANV